ncbi:hypothetical protein A0H81_07876 [Grifola frondosa]|uniref:Uncharacterized protein n=1 Tax=Grifola frondosa TaxID=5627 RepID=A0A1C7MBV8_GRIFR|nr:hypothetical protein A0H81_07876 [Grifola frondosa]
MTLVERLFAKPVTVAQPDGDSGNVPDRLVAILPCKIIALIAHRRPFVIRSEKLSYSSNLLRTYSRMPWLVLEGGASVAPEPTFDFEIYVNNMIIFTQTGQYRNFMQTCREMWH